MEWVLLIGAALLIGVAKTSFGGLASLSVAMLALAMPTKESTAAALLLLITGDVVAVLRYRKAADWKLLRGLIPAVVPGLLLGAWFLSWVDDLVLKRSIGALLLLFVLIQLAMMLFRRPQEAEDAPPHRALTVSAGVLAGFTTMAANAAGPVMAIYLQLAKVEKLSAARSSSLRPAVAADARASSLASASSWVSPTSFGIFTSFWDRVVSFSSVCSVSCLPSVSVSRETWVSVGSLSEGLVNRPPSREKNTMTTTTTKRAATTPRPVRTFSSWVVSLSSSCWRDGAFCLPPRPSGTFLA